MDICRILKNIKTCEYYTPKNANITIVTVVRDQNLIFVEFILGFSHTHHIKWLLPDITPTNKYIRFPITMVIRVFCKKHYCVDTVLWNHACVLYQIGLLKKTTLLKNCIIGSEICDQVLGNIAPIISSTQDIIIDYDPDDSCTALLTKEEIKALWNIHMQYEFVEKDAEKLSTVLANNTTHIDIATQTGGDTKKSVTGYYKYDFLPCLPDGNTTQTLHLIIGNNTLIEVLNWTFIHSIPMNHMLPGIRPTYKPISILVIAIAKFNGCGKMTSENVYWDQYSVLQQAGLIN